MKTKSQFTYQVGDRVAERPKTHGLITNQPKVKERIAKYRNQRYGTVISITTKKNSLGRSSIFLLVQWDHLKSPTEHAQFRICPISELDKLTKEVIVLGE